MPASARMECGAPGTHLCMECVTEQDRRGVLHKAHVEIHPPGEYGESLRLVNSPRMGLCGYDRPRGATARVWHTEGDVGAMGGVMGAGSGQPT